MKTNLSYRFLLALALVLACSFLFGCTKVYPFQKEHLDGHYVVVDYRDVREGPSVGNEILVGVFDLVVAEDKSVKMSGSWMTTGTAVGLNLKLDPARVTMEDETDLTFSFGLVEGSRNSFIIKGEYSVSGVIWDKKSSRTVPYEASGWFDARKDVGR